MHFCFFNKSKHPCEEYINKYLYQYYSQPYYLQCALPYWEECSAKTKDSIMRNTLNHLKPINKKMQYLIFCIETGQPSHACISLGDLRTYRSRLEDAVSQFDRVVSVLQYFNQTEKYPIDKTIYDHAIQLLRQTQRIELYKQYKGH